MNIFVADSTDASKIVEAMAINLADRSFARSDLNIYIIYSFYDIVTSNRRAFGRRRCGTFSLFNTLKHARRPVSLHTATQCSFSLISTLLTGLKALQQGFELI